MSNLLFIQAFPRGMQSKSIQIAQTYLSILREQNPDLNIDVLSLWDVDLPAFDGNRAAAKITVMLGQEPTYILRLVARSKLTVDLTIGGPVHRRLRSVPGASLNSNLVLQLKTGAG